MSRLLKIEISGFRAFGAEPQILEFRGPMAVIWGPNSQGKTSLAEAIEFLLTGRTVRREFLASAAREFAGSLRNVHLENDSSVVVSAKVEDRSGRIWSLERRLLNDYTGRDACSSELMIDSNRAENVAVTGIRLSQFPLESPILMQHTLRYVVSAEPQKRADYFKALLEISDLEDVRAAIVEAKKVLELPASPLQDIMDRCVETKVLTLGFAQVAFMEPTAEGITENLAEALGKILSYSIAATESLDERISAAKRLLQTTRETAFPLQGFSEGEQPRFTAPEDTVWSVLQEFVQLKSSVDQDAARLNRLFEAVLSIPDLASEAGPVDCPVCETPQALTPHRIATIREKLTATESYRKMLESARSAFSTLTHMSDQIKQSLIRSQPAFLGWDQEKRNRIGFTEDRIRSLVGVRAEALLSSWKDEIKSFVLSHAKVTGLIDKLEGSVRAIDLQTIDAETIEDLKVKVETVSAEVRTYNESRREYLEKTQPLVEAIRSEVDRVGLTEGWEDLITLAEQSDALRYWLIERRARELMAQELDQAIAQFDAAKAQVLDDKFVDLSDEIAVWWQMLRPDEPTSFEGIQRGGTGRRFIDLKARLSNRHGKGATSILRDAVAVFSDSQLNCLGLSAFLARTARDGAGFVVLDDPVPASDEEHRAMFMHHVLKGLIERSLQVIITTHDERMWKDMQETYRHLDLDTFLISLDDPVVGAVIENRGETLDALLARVTPYIDNTNPDIRKIGANRLRDAAERFCKTLLVRDCQQRGDSATCLSDYDGKTYPFRGVKQLC